MKFSTFFHAWLHKNYYKNAIHIGKKGDFFTTVSVGNLFGTLLAKHFLDLLDKKILTPPIEVIEMGANEGYLSRDFLSALLTLKPDIFKDISFFIIEPHKKLRLLQKNNLQGIDFQHKISLKKCQFNNAFIFANELFDSFACELIDNDTMAFVEDFKLVFKPINKEIQKECKFIGLQKGEFCIHLRPFFHELNMAFKKFIFASFDYGRKNKTNFSLRIFKKHEIFDFFQSDLKEFFGKSDLTYDVDFHHLIKLTKEYNFNVLNFKKQKQAFLDFGFEELLSFTQTKNPKAYENFLLQAKNLFFNFNDKFHFFEFQKT